jgi:hypothetical protein
MFMKVTKLFAMAAMAVVGSAGSAMAQASIFCGGATEAVLAASPSITCRLTNTVSATVPTVARLGITSTTTTLNAPLAADFATAAGVNSNGPTLNVRANAGYTLTASAAAPTWTGPSGSSKPATDLKMNVDGAGNVALGQVGTSSVATATTDYVIAYNTIYNWTTDIPGTYSLVVNYTLTAP